jgi:SpoVK/Ycf46/Vps4 family AAA+-type ATPase
MAIWERAKRCPHLLCCIAIDEIEALTPKRNDKAAGHKVDALSLLLSLVGGIKDIPNVYLIGSTNFKNKIDDAFSRRIEDNFFIRKLTNEQRVAMLKHMTAEEANLPNHVEINFDKISDLVAKVTTNFSGAALAALRTRLLTYFDLNRENKNIKTISEELLIDLGI